MIKLKGGYVIEKDTIGLVLYKGTGERIITTDSNGKERVSVKREQQAYEPTLEKILIEYVRRCVIEKIGNDDVIELKEVIKYISELKEYIKEISKLEV